MRIATATLSSISPYSQSRAHESEKLNRETPDAHEARTWREKCHTNGDGNVYIPPMAFKMAVDKAASMLGLQIPGRGKATYTKFFLSGVICLDPLVLPDKKDTVRGERIHANADGKRGSGKRVWRTFPVVDRWEGTVQFTLFADEIVPDVFEQVLKQSGVYVGIGRFRPENGGTNGRFKVDKVVWKQV
jgi:hypothetical protein